MPRFVVLEHRFPEGHARELHWDLMLEDGSQLRTWALAETPVIGSAIPAEALPPHRRAYLDYEGPVSDDRGDVARWDDGEFDWLGDEAKRVELAMHGERLVGRAVLECQSAATQRWVFTWLG